MMRSTGSDIHHLCFKTQSMYNLISNENTKDINHPLIEAVRLRLMGG